MYPRRSIPQRLLIYAAVAALIVLACVLFNTDRNQGPKWYAPYLSAAANVEWGAFRYDLAETIRFSDLTPEKREEYRFRHSEELTPYKHNAVGYVYVVAAATTVFPWLPDMRAIEALQIALHAAFCTWIIFLLRSPAEKILFLALYAVNPLVIYYVTIPFYYFSQAIPSFILLLMLLSRDDGAHPQQSVASLLVIGAAATLGIAFLTRPTTIGAVAAFFVLAVARPRLRWPAVAGLAVFLLVVVTGRVPDSHHGPWHTAYIGIGAYPSEYVPDDYVPAFNDDVGYALYRDKTGVDLDNSLGGNYYDDGVVIEYIALARQQYLSILKQDWPRLVRNAVLNTLQGFSVGYIRTQGYWFHCVVAVSGLIVVWALAWTRQYLLILLIAVTIGAFVPFAPPIPGYMYGAYPLLAFGAVQVFRRRGLLAPVDTFLARFALVSRSARPDRAAR